MSPLVLVCLSRPFSALFISIVAEQERRRLTNAICCSGR